MYSLDAMFYKYLLVHLVSFKASISLLIFLSRLSVHNVNGVLKYLTVIVSLPIFPIRSVNICFVYPISYIGYLNIYKCHIFLFFLNF